MASFNQAVLTSAGIALLAKVQADEDTIVFTSFVTGDGYYGDGEALTGRTALKKQRQSFPINSKEVINDSTVLITCVVTNKDLKAGYYIKEVGIYAKPKNSKSEPVLYSIATAVTDQWDYLPAYNNLLPATITMEFYTEVQNAKEVTLQASEVAYAPAEALERLSKRVDAMALDTPLAVIDHDLDCYPNPAAFAYQYGAGMGGAGDGPAGGTNLLQIPIKLECSGKNNLTIYSTRDIAKPEIEKELHKISDTEYAITYKDNEIDAVYIRLLPTQQPKLRFKNHLSHELATLHHGLGAYPQAIAGILQYGAGIAGAGIGPAGGTDIEQIPIRAVWHDNESLTLYTEEDIQPDALSEVTRVSDSEYVITYGKGIIESIYIRLLTGQSVPVVTPPSSDTDMMVSVAAQAVNAHNNSKYAHPDIRLDGGKF